MAPNEKRWLTIAELAAYLSCSRSKLYHAVSQGTIPFTKRLGSLRFDRARIDEWLTESAYDPAEADAWASKQAGGGLG